MRTRRSGILAIAIACVLVRPTQAYQPSSLANLVVWADARQTPFSDAGITPATHGAGVNYWTDLSGAGNHLRQTTGGNQPLWNATDGSVETVEPTFTPGQAYLSASALNVNRRSFSAYFITTDLISLISRTGHFHTLMASGDGNFKFGYAPNTSNGPSTARVLAIYDGTSWQTDTVQIPTSPALLGFACGASNCKLIVNDHVTTITTLASGTTASGTTYLGQVPGSNSAQLVGGVRMVVAQSSQSSTQEITDVQAWAKTVGAIDTADVRNVIVWLGDSITDGEKATMNQTWQRRARPRMPRAVEYTVALGGSKITEYQSTYLAIANTYITASKRNTLHIFGGTNDLAAAVSGATTFTNLLALVASAKVAGFDKVAVCTMLPRTSLDTERAAYNTAIRNDGSAHFDALADWAGNAAMGDNSDNLDTTYYNADAIHPNSVGMAIGAPIIATAVKGLMLDSGRVRR